MEHKPLKVVIYIGASPEHIWRLFIEPEGTKKLFFDCILESTFEQNSQFAYVGPGVDGDRTVHLYGNWLSFEPYKHFSYIEHPGPSYNPKHEQFQSRVSISLEPEAGVTKLTLINDHWTDDHPGYDRTAQAWPIILSNVKTLAETGSTLKLKW